jgi:two-component system, chemotaxis family, protein-glutamate methylesterase/glutaminase
MRDNVGIAELSSPMLRDLMREACASVGRVVTYADADEARAALLRNPPKVLVIGGAPLDQSLLEPLKKASATHGVIGLVVADTHDLQLALQAGALEGFTRSPEGLRQLALRLRPLLAPSLRPAPGASLRPPSASAGQAQANASAAQLAVDKSDSPCAMIALGSFAAHGDAAAYLLSRLPNTLPGIVLLHGHIQPVSELKDLLAEECSWRVHEAGDPGFIAPGTVWIAHRSTTWRPRVSHLGIALERVEPAARSGGRSSRPAGLAGMDTFFEAVAQTLGARALGVLLGASGDEGSYGLWALRNAGSYTLAQRDPSAALHEERGGSAPPPVAHEVLGLETLPQAITAYCQGQNSYRSLRPPS